MKFKKPVIISLAVGLPIVAISAVQTAFDAFSTDSSNSVLPGSHSMALGTGNTAADKSLTIGINNTAEIGHGGQGRSLAVGEDNYATRDSISSGWDNDALWGGFSQGVKNSTNYYAAGIGAYNNTSRYSIGLGRSNTLHQFSIGIGSGNSSMWAGHPSSGGVENKDVLLLGRNNTTLLKEANHPKKGILRNVLVGDSNISDVDDAIVLGTGNTGVEGVVVVGNYNDPSDPDLVDAAVVLSAGTDGDGNERNGLIVKENGDVIIPKKQGDISMGIYGN